MQRAPWEGGGMVVEEAALIFYTRQALGSWNLFCLSPVGVLVEVEPCILILILLQYHRDVTTV